MTRSVELSMGKFNLVCSFLEALETELLGTSYEPGQGQAYSVYSHSILPLQLHRLLFSKRYIRGHWRGLLGGLNMQGRIHGRDLRGLYRRFIGKVLIRFHRVILRDNLLLRGLLGNYSWWHIHWRRKGIHPIVQRRRTVLELVGIIVVTIRHVVQFVFMQIATKESIKLQSLLPRLFLHAMQITRNTCSTVTAI